MGTPATPAIPAPKVSWLKRFGHILGTILKTIAKDAKPIADAATPVAEALLPQFSAEIQIADNLVTNIAKQAIITETMAAATGAAASGPEKLQAVLANVGPEIDAWVAAKFPGSKAVSDAGKAGLVNAIVAIANEVEPTSVIAVP